MLFNRQYLNRTKNQSPRREFADTRPLFVVWHETASPNPNNPFGTLEFNLKRSVGSSYHALIARDGTAFLYLDPNDCIAWHSGKRNETANATFELNGRTFKGFGVNAWSFGVELDGACDGTPITPAQLNTAAELARWVRDTLGIPLKRTHHVMHKELTDPSYRRDPRCVSVDAILAAAQSDGDEQRDRPAPGVYEVVVDEARVREGPGTAFPEALGGTVGFRRDTVLEIDSVHLGEEIADNPWWLHLDSGIGFMWSGLLKLQATVPIAMDQLSVDSRLMSAPRATLEQCQSFLVSKPHGVYDDDDVRWIARLYFDTAGAVGLDPLVAIAQMVHATEHLTSDWSQPPRRNPAGIGVTGQPDVGLTFPSWSLAVRAHVGRLLAYAIEQGASTSGQQALIAEALNWRPLPDELRGSVASLAGLSGTWDADAEYAEKIAKRARAILKAS